MSSPLTRRQTYDLVVVAAAARAGTFSHPAHELGMTQSAVSHHVAALERDLGTSLFRRQWRGVALTEEGLLLLDAVSRGTAMMAEGVPSVRRAAAGRNALTLVTDFAFVLAHPEARCAPGQRSRRRRPHPHQVDVRILTKQSSGALDLTAGDAAIALCRRDSCGLARHAADRGDRRAASEFRAPTQREAPRSCRSTSRSRGGGRPGTIISPP